MSWENKKVLVVGGAGYIGGAVTDILLKEGIPFSVYDNLLYENQYLKPVDFIFGDVRDQEKLASILPNYSHVIWLAAIVGDGACAIRPDLTVQVNQNSVEWLAKNYQGRIIFLSTCSVYGQNDNEVDENSLLNPLSLYAKTKIEAEKYLANSNSLVFRLGTVFGVSDTYARIRMDLAVNYMTARAITNGKLTIFGGNQWRPLVHVKNVAEAIVSSLEKPLKGVYNISGLNYKIADLGEEIAKITNSKIEYVDIKFEDLRNYHVSVTKANQAGILPFKHLLTVADGVREMSDLVFSGRIKYTDNDIYSNEKHIANLNNHGSLT